eukprot:5474296-Prymnesium_polylepis.1
MAAAGGGRGLSGGGAPAPPLRAVAPLFALTFASSRLFARVVCSCVPHIVMLTREPKQGIRGERFRDVVGPEGLVRAPYEVGRVTSIDYSRNVSFS